jgi:uncharacterized delta-60 repeat protein
LQLSGKLDSAFGGGGTVSIDVPNKSEGLVDVEVAPNGDVTAVGLVADRDHRSPRTCSSPAGRRRDPRPSFSGDGYHVLDTGYAYEEVEGFAVAQDGDLLATPSARALGRRRRLAALRVTPSGAPDAGFGGGDGVQIVSVPAYAASKASGVAPHPDGGVVLGGYTSDPNRVYAAVAVRLRADGSPDPAFSQDGIQTTSFPGSGTFPVPPPRSCSPTAGSSWPAATAA